MGKKNTYVCLVCGEWFETKEEKAQHTCKRVLTRDGKLVAGKKKMTEDGHKEERRILGERLKELGKISKRSEINFTDIDELREMVEEAETKLENNEDFE
jgi:hypothetical protein